MSEAIEYEDGPWVCPDCTTFCVFGTPLLTPCDRTGCRCERCERSRRALEVDDRPDDKLAAVARDLEAESRPSVAELVAERFAAPTRAVDNVQAPNTFPQHSPQALTSEDLAIVAKNHSPYTGKPTTIDDLSTCPCTGCTQARLDGRIPRAKVDT